PCAPCPGREPPCASRATAAQPRSATGYCDRVLRPGVDLVDRGDDRGCPASGCGERQRAFWRIVGRDHRNFSRGCANGRLRSAWAMLNDSGWCEQGIAFDAHGGHLRGVGCGEAAGVGGRAADLDAAPRRAGAHLDHAAGLSQGPFRLRITDNDL
ncbi:MAG: hypothetical protein ACJARS_003657, partial [bacterium]